jgi:ribosomal protein S1
METNPAATLADNLKQIKRKTHFSGTVIKTTLAGAIIDIGLDTPGVVHISQLQKEPVKRVEDILQVGQSVDVWVRNVFPKKGRIDLTMIKPLEYEWNDLKKDLVVHGKVVRLEKFGVFVDIGSERPGLVHISEMTHGYIRNPGDVVKEGDEVDAMVLEVNRQKKQIKLSMKALEEKPEDVVKAVLSKPTPREKSKDREKEKDKENVAPTEEREEPVPTAMEMALREAMQRSQSTEGEVATKSKRKTQQNGELDGILNRTLKNRAVTK